MAEKLVSVIIPTYNRAEMLSEAIESVLVQTYENFEILILDNCSPDHTPEIVASFSDTRIKYVRHLCNIGSTANWTYGVHWAEGEFLAILADDDKYKPEFLSRRVRAITRAPNLVMAFGYQETYEANGDYIHKPVVFEPGDLILQGEEFLLCALKGIFVGATLFRSESVARVWNDVITGGMTGDLLLSILLAADPSCSGICIQDRDYEYRIHDGQDSSSNRDKGIEHSIVMLNSLMHRNKLRPYPDVVRKGVVYSFNHLGRFLWDRGNVVDARRCFLLELRFDIFRFATWLRLLRSYVIRPKQVILT